MSEEKHAEIILHLGNIHDLFTRPIEDPFSEQFTFLSGIEVIKDELTLSSLRAATRARIMIFLPKKSMEPELARKTSAALQRYCRLKMQQNRRTMVKLQRQATVALLLGILFLIGGLILSQVLVRAGVLPPLLTTLFSDGFVIAFWVILWRPVDFFLFELWPYWRDERIYRLIMQMEITIAEELDLARGVELYEN